MSSHLNFLVFFVCLFSKTVIYHIHIILKILPILRLMFIISKLNFCEYKNIGNVSTFPQRQKKLHLLFFISNCNSFKKRIWQTNKDLNIRIEIHQKTNKQINKNFWDSVKRKTKLNNRFISVFVFFSKYPGRLLMGGMPQKMYVCENVRTN